MRATDTTLTGFLAQIAAAPEAELIFVSDGRESRPGYHVTELKSATVRSIDCGRESAEWRETLVQILDGPAGTEEGTMTAGKFTEIANAGLAYLPELSAGALYFEYAPGNAPMQKLQLKDLEAADGRILVNLASLAAACKPAVRWSAEAAAATDDTRAVACCG